MLEKFKQKPLVAIQCITYNHEPYIRDALEGFVMQKTDFPFVAIVHDDASTDKTADIIREYAEKYPDIIKPIFETENQYSKKDGSLGRIMNDAISATGAKYIAMCEGDDYWTDPLKLQKQVDFLESNNDYAMCYTQARIFYQQKQTISKNIYGKKYSGFTDLLKRNKIPTASVVYRMKDYKMYLSEVKPQIRGWKMGDYPLWLYFSIKSNIHCIESVTSIYRFLNQSASHVSNTVKQFEFGLNSYLIREWFSVNYNKGILYVKFLKLAYIIKYYLEHDITIKEIMYSINRTNKHPENSKGY